MTQPTDKIQHTASYSDTVSQLYATAEIVSDIAPMVAKRYGTFPRASGVA